MFDAVVILAIVGAYYVATAWGARVGYEEGRYECAQEIARVLRAGRPRTTEREEEVIHWIQETFKRPS